jgi:hypothetical protein
MVLILLPDLLVVQGADVKEVGGPMGLTKGIILP